jgi:hypothetical protein
MYGVWVGAGPEQRLNGAHCLHQPGLPACEAAATRLRFRALSVVECGESSSALGCQFKEDLAAIGLGSRPANQAALFELAQDAAEIAWVESQFLAEFGGSGLRTVGDLVQNARLRQRKRAVEKTFTQYTDLPGVETVEAADGVDFLIDVLIGPGCRLGRHIVDSSQLSDKVNYIVDYVN